MPVSLSSSLAVSLCKVSISSSCVARTLTWMLCTPPLRELPHGSNTSCRYFYSADDTQEDATHPYYITTISQTPAWGMPPVPQFNALAFDMCLLIQHSPQPRITLFWGRNSEVPMGFNPLMSPTLKRQIASSAGGASNGGSASSLR
jgi:hypothetical protein